MSKKERTISHIMEILHPVLLAALAGPVCYTVFENRVDAWVQPLFLLGLLLLPLSAAVRIAERRVRSMWAFLLISAAAFAGVFYIGRTVSGIVFGASGAEESLYKAPATIAMLVLALGGAWLTLSAIWIRLRENRRERARVENDYTWQEKSIVAEKPAAAFLILWVQAYLAGLLNACPSMCNTAIAGGTAYMIVTLVYRSIEVNGKYMQDTQSVANVPRRKISEIRTRLLALLIGALCMVSATAFFTAGARTYRDLRTWELKGQRIKVESHEIGDQSPDFEVIKEELGLGRVEHKEPPEWLLALEEIASTVIVAGFALFLLYRIWRSINGTAKEFAEVREENGDIAVRLENAEEETDRLSAGGVLRFMQREPLTERGKIRQEYRRAIRKYRKDTPGKSETPAEIESGADFPQGFDTAALHDRYEKARYGSP